MTIIDKIKDLLRMLAENIHRRRKVVLALSCVVVFVTTYMLILPAFTLEKTKAAEQGGIDVPGVTATAEDVSEDEEAEEAGQADGQDIQAESGKTEDGKAEDSGSKESKDSGEAKADSAQTADPLTFEDEHYTIAVDDKNSVLPENTEIKVEEIDKNEDAKKYQKHFDDALAAIQEKKDGENVSDLEFARFYDISLVSDGKEVTLGKGDKVSVNIEYDKELRKALGVENKDNIRIIHFAENKDTGKVEAEVLDNKEAKVTAETTEDNLLKEAAFDAESFSVYGLVYVKEAEEEAANAEEKTEETAANSEIDLGTAVVSTVDGSDLPEDVDGHADVVAGKKAIAAVEKKVDDIDADKTEFKVFDIALENVDESEYKDGFKVDVTLPEGIQGKDFRLFHIHDGKVDELDVQTNGSKTVDGFTFETENFSQFVLSYTVDFEYTIDGETFYFSIEGGSSIRASRLFKALNIDVAIDDVAGIKFSDPELLTARKAIIGNDWVIKSNKSFKTEETMTVTLTDGSSFEVKVTDAQPVDLRDAVTGVTISQNGTTITDGDTVIEGKTYEFKLSFQENPSLQFSNDDTAMYYTLPAGVTPDNTSGTFTMDFGRLGKLENNTYEVNNGVLTIHWNTNDTRMMNILKAADEAHFEIDISGSFNGTSNHIEWNDSIKTDVNVSEVHDASVNKTGYYDSNDGKIKYTVTVASEGTTTGIKVKDTITGTALNSDVHSASDITITKISKNGQQTPVTVGADALNVNGKTFELSLPDLQDGERYEVHYSASVDYSKLGQNGRTTYQETNNGVTLDWNENQDNPPKESNSYEYNINYSSLTKKVTNISEIENDHRILTWEVEANKERKVAVDYIKDTIRSDSTGIMDMYGDGITVEVTKQDGTTTTRTLTWGETGSNGSLTKSADNNEWTYVPPASDGIASYKITYQTIADVSGLTGQSKAVNNDVDDGENKTSGGTQVVGPPNPDIPEDPKPSIIKNVASFDAEETNWSIDVSIPKEGTTETKIIDELPSKGVYGYVDNYKGLTVTGLLDEESYEVKVVWAIWDRWSYIEAEYDEGVTPEDSSGGEHPPYQKRVIINLKHKENGNWVAGLLPTGNERNIHVDITTETSQEWLKAADKDYWTYKDHTNTASIGAIKSQATVSPSLKKITKANEKINFEDDKVMLEDGKWYPVFKYTAILQGVTDGRVEIFDTFDTDVFEILDLDELHTEHYQYYNPFTRDLTQSRAGIGGIYKGTNITTFDKGIDSHIALLTPLSNGVLISTDGLDKTDDGQYYTCYKIEYYLVMKHPDVAAQKALAEGGKTTFTNKVDWDGAKSEVDVEYGNPIVDKNQTYDERNRQANYTITINPDKLMLGAKDAQGNYPEMLTLTDTFSSTLSIDYSSIRITTEPGENAPRPLKSVSYDYSGNKGTFQIPNGTKVVITYTCNVIGSGTLQLYNKAELDGGYTDFTEDYREVTSSGEGGATVLAINLLKYESGHMEKGSLAGAVFRILDSEKNPIKYTDKAQDEDSASKVGQEIHFTTDENDNTLIMLSQAEHGVTLKKDTVYYLEEIQAPDGFQLDTTLYSFVISNDPNHANYTRDDGVWVYYVGDILKIRNQPEETQLVLSKRFHGNYNLTDEQKAKLRFTVVQVDENGTPVAGGFNKVISYSDFRYDKYTISSKTDPTFTTGYYKVIESYSTSLDLPDDVVESTTYSVSANGTTVTGTDKESSPAQVVNDNTTNVVFTNDYSTGAYFFTKLEAGTEQPIKDAEFTVYLAANDEAVTTYKTGDDGKFSITREEAAHSTLDTDTLYYVVETKAAEGYEIPNPAPKYYFYFGSDGAQPPEGASANNAVNLYEGSVHQDIFNAPNTSIMVKKEWRGADGSDISNNDEVKNVEIHVTLKRKTSAGVDESFAKSDTLTYRNNWYKVWDKLDKTDSAGNAYSYYVEETPVPDDYEVSYSSNNEAGIESGTITVTNTKNDVKSSVKVTKAFSGIDALPEGFKITNDFNNEEFTVENAVKEDGSVKIPYEWILEDVPVGRTVTFTESGILADGYSLKVNGTATAADSATATATAAAPDAQITTASFVNEYSELTSAKVVKAWNHSGNTGTTPQSLKVRLSNGDEFELNEGNNWSATANNLPKYGVDEEGNPKLIEYTWTEEQLPPGYYLDSYKTETGTDGVITTTLTNAFSKEYSPTTVITGKKIWNDDGKNRPDSITVNLYKKTGTGENDKELVESKTVAKPTGNPDSAEWPFEFTNLPVFNEDGSLIEYVVEEVLPSGQASVYGTVVEFTQATYVAGKPEAHIINSYQAENELCNEKDLGFVVIRHGNSFVVWTPRPLQSGELDKIKAAAVKASDQFNKIYEATGDDLRIISGVPHTIDVGNKHAASVEMRDGSVWVNFLKSSAQSDIVYGKIPYTYTPAGGTAGGTITNTPKVTDFEFQKEWRDGEDNVKTWDKDITVTVQRKAGDSVDSTFSLTYNITKNDIEAGVSKISGANQEDPDLEVSIVNNKYVFKVSNLPFTDEDGNRYTYFVTETNAQLDGYNEPTYSNTRAETLVDAAYDGGTIINKEANGYELPHTGGIGTTIFYIFGSILVIGGGIYFISRRRAMK